MLIQGNQSFDPVRAHDQIILGDDRQGTDVLNGVADNKGWKSQLVLLPVVEPIFWYRDRGDLKNSRHPDRSPLGDADAEQRGGIPLFLFV